LPALHAPRHEAGWVSPEALAAIAAHLRVPLCEVYGVATHYYPEVRLTKQGVRLVRVCTGVSCRVTGGGTLLSACEERLGIRAGETSRDGTVTLEEMDCAFDCAVAWVVEVDGSQVGRVQAADLPDLLYGTRGTQHPTPPSAASPVPAPGELEPAVLARQQRVLLECWGSRLRLIAPVHDPGVVRALLAHRGLAPAPDRPRTGPAPARPRRGHRLTPARGPGRPLTIRSACSSINGDCRQGGSPDCAAHAALDDAPVPGAGSPQEPDQSRAVSAPGRGLRGRRLDDGGVFQGVLVARWMGPRDANWRYCFL